jgi:hypothetical protein
MYAALSPLEDPRSEAVASDAIEWYGARGWLDELANAALQRVIENAREWSTSERVGSVTKEDEDEAEDTPTDSNSDPYLTDWWPHGGRDVSITLGMGDEVKQWSGGEELDQSIEQIESVVRDSRC